MTNAVKLENGKFYQCSRLHRDSEYGMQVYCGVKCRNIEMPIYATIINGELREIVSGLKLQLVHIDNCFKYEYSNRSYQELKLLKSGYFYINDAFEVSKEKVAIDLNKMEEYSIVELFKTNLEEEYHFQQKTVYNCLSKARIQNESEQYASKNTDKIIKKFLSNF